MEAPLLEFREDIEVCMIVSYVNCHQSNLDRMFVLQQ